jgi:hypothetical protein
VPRPARLSARADRARCFPAKIPIGVARTFLFDRASRTANRLSL